MRAAGQLIDKRDFDGAIAAYDKLIHTYPNYARLWALRSMSYMGKRDIDHASKDLESADKLDPHEGMTFRARGLIADHKEDYRGAADAFSQSLTVFANNPSTFCAGARIPVSS